MSVNYLQGFSADITAYQICQLECRCVVQEIRTDGIAGRERFLMGTVGVLGAGSWGTALAVHLARVGHEVRLWARDAALVEDMRQRRANAVYLADVTLPEAVTGTLAWKGREVPLKPGNQRLKP